MATTNRRHGSARREDERSILTFLNDDVVAGPVFGQRHGELGLGFHLPQFGIRTARFWLPSDGSLMEARGAGRGIRSHPHARPKACIYGLFPPATHTHRPSPQPFTQEIAGSNPAGGTTPCPSWATFTSTRRRKLGPRPYGLRRGFLAATRRCGAPPRSPSREPSGEHRTRPRCC
jgi:hypothetical protein